ncbi:hypothetical protein BD289DRAFT_416262 [Coniella lustricola]|uniref:Chorismate synthase protein n=1 Tax=Coniella lustricola TaxID=2025994 RepID=A0A2T2ZX39_9PEZI|nr:hypothetical protein BD289DRAFT_416262 [Coniella lustricola]
MAVVTWGTIRSLLIFFGPMLVPKAITWYRTARNAPKAARKPVVALPRASLLVILLLSFSALTLFTLGAVPRLAPENLFTLTRSNPTTSNNLLASRLATLRPLTERDERIIHTKFESKASKLLYYKYGPDALANCPFCTSQDPTTYLLYAIPAVAIPHLLNAVLVGVSTSLTLTGKAGAQWRSLATYAAASVAIIDFYALSQWDHVSGNEKARILAEVFFFHWTARTMRFLALAGLQLTLAGVLYLSSTNRMFVPATTASERIDTITAALGVVNMRIRSANVLKNTVARDADLRAIDVSYWAHEGVVMQEAMESMEVVESMRDAVENRRIDPQAMEQAADAFAQRVMGDAGVDGFAG